jgi:protein involved in polysaccharide export with SLBB domain
MSPNALPCRLALLALLLFVGLGPAACNVAPDKRLLQYLNTDGFGWRYSGNAEEENYVSIGDTIQVEDSINPEEFKGVGGKVQIDGTVLLPELGAVAVAGNTRSELEALLTSLYAPYFPETDFVVNIETKGKKYFIFGEVRKEGEANFPGDLTVFEAVMNATPNNESANLGRVRLIKPDPSDPWYIVVNIGEMLDSGDSTFNVHVQEGDIIYVPPRILAQLGYFLNDLISPFTSVLRNISQAVFGAQGRGRNARGAGNFGGIF